MSPPDKKPISKKSPYDQCLQYLTVDAEQKGLKQIALTLETARKKIKTLHRKRGENDNFKPNE